MKIHRLIGTFGSNIYIIDNEQGEGIVIDPSGKGSKILEFAFNHNITLKYALLTHGHFDHIGAGHELQQQGVKIIVHKDDADKLYTQNNMGAIFSRYVEPFFADEVLKGDTELDLISIKIKAIHTPGHTRGGTCYIIGDNIFTGDTIFCEDIGRSDIGKEGSFADLKNSIVNKLFRLSGDYKIYPGHEEATTLEHERKFNPINNL